MSCLRWQIPIHLGPLLETSCPHSYFPNPPSPPPTPLARTILQRRHQQFWSSWSGTLTNTRQTLINMVCKFFMSCVVFSIFVLTFHSHKMELHIFTSESCSLVDYVVCKTMVCCVFLFFVFSSLSSVFLEFF